MNKLLALISTCAVAFHAVCQPTSAEPTGTVSATSITVLPPSMSTDDWLWDLSVTQSQILTATHAISSVGNVFTFELSGTALSTAQEATSTFTNNDTFWTTHWATEYDFNQPDIDPAALTSIQSTLADAHLLIGEFSGPNGSQPAIAIQHSLIDPVA